MHLHIHWGLLPVPWAHWPMNGCASGDAVEFPHSWTFIGFATCPLATEAIDGFTECLPVMHIHWSLLHVPGGPWGLAG